MPDINTENTSTAEEIARQIAASPRLRADYLEDSTATVSKLVPKKAKPMARMVAGQVKEHLDKESPAIIHAATIQQQFFSEAMRNPRIAFRILAVLAVAMFVLGVSMIAGATIAFFVVDDNVEKVGAAIFDGAGVITTLTSVYAVARRGVASANAIDTRQRLIVAAFSNEIANLIDIKQSSTSFETVQKVNEELRTTLTNAVRVLDAQFSLEDSAP